ncbi:DMT family transporter [Aestuariivirga sp.]|uniref:DMT family transporter n=1 Tax=Aestuariivirga sp. TaxID=2650926 RepID=UPI00391AAB21
MVTRARGTFFGALAIAAWSVYGVLLAAERETGPFLSMAIVFSFAVATLLLWRLARGEGLRGLLPMPLPTLALGFIGLFGSNILYVVSLSLGGEPVAVNIAALSWPVFMALFIAVFGVARPGWLDGLAMAVGFAGVVLLVTRGRSLAVDWAVLPALLGAVCWAALSALRTRVPPGPRDAMLHFAALSCLVAWVLALTLEGLSLPPPGEFLRLAVVGMLTVGLANHLWDVATRYGDPVLLASMSFMEPVASTALIALVLSQPVTWSDAGALLLVLAAVAASFMSERRRTSSSRR